MKLRYTLRSILIAGAAISLLFISSCQKEKSRDTSDDQIQMDASKVSSEADGEAEIIFNGLFDDAMGVSAEVGLGGTGIFGRTESCPTVTITRPTPALFPVRIVLDFGINGCIHPRDGHFRRGKIIIEYSDRLIHPGATATTTFDNFYFDSTKVEGTHKITNISSNTLSCRAWKMDVINAKLTRPNGNYTMWNSHKTLVQIEGCATPQIHMDDIFKIEGTAEGKVFRNNLLVLWNSSITEPLIKKFHCRWLVKGKIRTVRATTNTTSPWVAELNFSPSPPPNPPGGCDPMATITINGVTHIITLP